MTSRLSGTLFPSAGDIEDSSQHESGFTQTPQGGVMVGGVQEDVGQEVTERVEVQDRVGEGPPEDAGDRGSADDGPISVEASGEALGESSGMEPEEGPLIHDQTPVAVTDRVGRAASETPDPEESSSEVSVTLLPDDLTLTSEAALTGHTPTPTAPQEYRSDVEYSAEPPVTVETDDAHDVTDEERDEAATVMRDSTSLEPGHSRTPTPTTTDAYAGWTVVEEVEEVEEVKEEEVNDTHAASQPASQPRGDIGRDTQYPSTLEYGL